MVHDVDRLTAHRTAELTGQALVKVAIDIDYRIHRYSRSPHFYLWVYLIEALPTPNPPARNKRDITPHRIRKLPASTTARHNHNLNHTTP
jgi:hypothetical protein